MFYLVLYVLFLFISIGTYFAKSQSEIYLSKFLYYSIIVLLIIIGGFRYETGGDWPGYKIMYDGVLRNESSRSVEPLFKVVIYLASLFGSYQYIFLFCELIRFVTLSGILNSQLKNQSKYKCLFILLYFSMYYFYYDFVIIRQSTAVAIIAYAILKNKKAKFKTYLFWVLIASCFHYSALMMIFFYFPLYRFNTKTTTIIAIAITVSYFIGLDLVGSLIILILNLLPKGYILTRLYAYAIQTDLATARVLTGQSFVYLGVFLGTVFLKYVKHREYNPIIYNGIMVYMFFYLGLPSMFTLSTRLSTFFSIFMIFAIINLIDQYRKTVIVPVVLIGLCFCFYKGVFLNAPTHVSYNPYQFYPYYAITGKSTDGGERLIKVDAINTKLQK